MTMTMTMTKMTKMTKKLIEWLEGKFKKKIYEFSKKDWYIVLRVGGGTSGFKYTEEFVDKYINKFENDTCLFDRMEASGEFIEKHIDKISFSYSGNAKLISLNRSNFMRFIKHRAEQETMSKEEYLMNLLKVKGITRNRFIYFDVLTNRIC